MSQPSDGSEQWPEPVELRKVACCAMFEHVGKFSNYLRYVPFLEAMTSFEDFASGNSTSTTQYKSLVEEFISKTCQRLSLAETRSIVQREVFARTFADAKEETAAYYEQFAKETTVVVTAIGQEIARRVQEETVNTGQTSIPSNESLQPSTEMPGDGTNMQDEQEKVECGDNQASSSIMKCADGQETTDRMQVDTVTNHMSVAPSNASTPASGDRTDVRNKITNSEANSSATKHMHVSEDHKDTDGNDASLAAGENVRKVSKHSDLDNTPSLNVEDAAGSSLAQVTYALPAEHTRETEMRNRSEEYCLPGLSSEVAEKSRNVSSTNVPETNHSLKIQNVSSSSLAPNTPGAHDQDAPTGMSLEDVEKCREDPAHIAPQSHPSLPTDNIPEPSNSEEAQPCLADPAHGAQTNHQSNEELIDAPAASRAKIQDNVGTAPGQASDIMNKSTNRKRAPSNQLAPAQVNLFSDPNMTEAKKRRLQNLMDEWPVSSERRSAVAQAIKETLKKYCNNYECPTLSAKIRMFEADAFQISQSTLQYYGLVKDMIQFVDNHVNLAEVRRALESDVGDTTKAKERQQRLNAVFAEAVWRFLEQGGRMVLEKALELNRKISRQDGHTP